MRGNTPLKIAVFALFAAGCLLLSLSPAVAAASDREERWQFYFPLTYTASKSYTSGPSSIDISSDLGWGFAFGYNFTERWSLGFEITWTQSNYTATVPVDDDPPGGPNTGTQTLNSRLDASSLQIVGQFNFLETAVTPFIRAGLGSTFTDSNIVSGPPSGSCWWDPWFWVWRCGTFYPTYNTNSFSYQVGIGLRADVGDAFYLEVAYNQLWIDFNQVTPDFGAGRLNVGWLF